MPELDDAVVTRGRHIVLYSDPAIPVCPESLAVADRFVEDTAAMLGVEPRPIDYYLFDGPTGCGYGQYGTASCAMSGTVYANAWPHYHELVHAVDDSHPPALFIEGLAEALSIPSSDARRDPPPRQRASLPLESSSFRAGSPYENYRVAGDFIRYLVERFGAVRYRRFARSVASLSDAMTTRRAFDNVFDVALDDVIAAWRVADPAASTVTVPIDLAACADPIAPVGDETWVVDDAPPELCASGITENGTLYAQTSRRYGFEVTEPGLFAVHVIGEGTRRGQVRSCVVGAVYDYDMLDRAMTFTTLPLVAGRHAIELVEGASAFRIERIGGVGETCATAPTFTAPTNRAWQLDFRGRPGTWMRIMYAGRHPVIGYTRGTAPGRVCSGGCGARHCRSLAAGTTLEHAAGQALYVEIGDGYEGTPFVTVRTVDDEQD